MTDTQKLKFCLLISSLSALSMLALALKYLMAWL